MEIGAGTGKATIQFANRGYRIHAIEIGKDMAEILKRKCSKFSNVTMDVASFEEWNCTLEQKFDMIYSAQAFHWISKDIKYQKCYELLKENGYLVLFWYHPSGYKSPVAIDIDEQVQRIVNKCTAKYYINKGSAERQQQTGVFGSNEIRTEIEESGLFRIIGELKYTHPVRNCPQQYLKAMKSVPSFAAILDGLDAPVIRKMDNEIESIINNHGGFVDEEFHYSLYITQKNSKH